MLSKQIGSMLSLVGSKISDAAPVGGQRPEHARLRDEQRLGDEPEDDRADRDRLELEDERRPAPVRAA